MAKDPFDSIRFIEDIYRDRERIIGDMSVAQSPLKSLDIITMQKSLNLASKYEEWLKPRELKFLEETFTGIATNQFDAHMLENSLSSFLDVSPLVPEFEIANQLHANLFNATGNFSPRFAEFSSYVNAIPEEDFWYNEETGEVSPEIRDAVSIAAPSVKGKKLSADVITLILTLIMFVYQVYSDHQLGQFLDKMLEYEERQTVALETLAENSNDSNANKECNNLVFDNREYANDEQHQD